MLSAFVKTPKCFLVANVKGIASALIGVSDSVLERCAARATPQLLSVAGRFEWVQAVLVEGTNAQQIVAVIKSRFLCLHTSCRQAQLATSQHITSR